MPKFFRPSLFVAAVFSTLLLSACSPKYDWREVHDANASFTVLLPAKPSTFSRPVNLNGLQVNMTMTAAEAGDVMFAVGTAELPDQSQVPQALAAMKAAMLKNISGTVKSEKLSGPADAPTAIDIEASNATNNTSGQARVLFARFTAEDRRIYQAVIIGKDKKVTDEITETFFTSFKTR